MNKYLFYGCKFINRNWVLGFLNLAGPLLCRRLECVASGCAKKEKVDGPAGNELTLRSNDIPSPAENYTKHDFCDFEERHVLHQSGECEERLQPRSITP